MRSLRVKILSVTATLVLLSQLATVSLVLVTAKKEIAERASQSLRNGLEITQRANRTRAAQFENTVSALAADYGFKQAIASGDRPTAESALQNHARRAGADIAFVIDSARRLVAATGYGADRLSPEDFRPGNMTPAITAHATTLVGSAAFDIYTVPVNAPLQIAELSMGFMLDDAYTQQLTELTGLEVTLIASDGNQARIAATTLPSAISEGLLQRDVLSSISDAPQTFTLDGEEHLVLGISMAPGQQPVKVIFTKSLAEAMAPYALLKTASFALGALPLFAALIGALLLSRTLTQPVTRLVEAAQRIQTGDYSSPVEIRSGDELSQFGVAFNAMQTEIAAREERIAYQAQHDSVTGLYNTDYALEMLSERLTTARDGETIALVVVRLDALNDVAGSLGHDMAGEYLREVAKSISRFTDTGWILARLENDTFVLAFSEEKNCLARELSHELIERLRGGVRLPIANIAVSPVVGIALYPMHANSSEKLLLRATIALNEALADGRAVRLYKDGDEEKRLRNMTLLQDLQRAAQNDEFELHFQPKISLTENSVAGMEALVRWNHPTYGWLPPNDFIPLVETSGNVSVVTRWVISAAARHLRQWCNEGLDLHVAVNLSARDLLDHDLPWFVLDVLHKRNIDPARMTLEVTEEAMVKDFVSASSTLRRLHELGMPLAIDDFGTGYSSLGQLKLLPVQEIKIDRSFVMSLPDDPADRAIVSTTIDLAHKLNLRIVAEGVGSGAACRWLAAQGVDQAQGYYWSAPMPGNEVTAWVGEFSGGSTQQLETLKRV